VLADYVSGTFLRDVALVVGAAGFVGILAQISYHIPGTPVPVTGQTLGVLLAGTALGWRRAMSAMALYAVAGVAGVPWFEGHAHGYPAATFRYIVAFVFCAGLCGFLAERGVDRTLLKSLPAMLAGEAVIYLIGVTWLKVDLHVSVSTAIAYGFTPFWVADAIKMGIAALMLPATWKLVGRR
jgi:biotin transport system substrate-specific component